MTRFLRSAHCNFTFSCICFLLVSLNQYAATVQLTVIVFNYFYTEQRQNLWVQPRVWRFKKWNCEIEKYRGSQWKAENRPSLSSSVCVFVFFQAISSLSKYPLPLQTAREAKILQNFGDGICKILDEKLQRYYRDNGKTPTSKRRWMLVLIDWWIAF